ncbi:DUF6884 domain-containing protein [Phytohabitans houttuyneae]|uniref:DUF6884 domain-containing protein n=1 Tax=Phytohabitans houttuyneae TaxID=1076126 RepID=A0A6V8JXL9_9ACTN|nr:DUF6884 domain-containing protein [Phytohabitans houttuyneae]GFJ77472.1 hypothetical protein Phou_016520 [Phytohabitans houttuyneae]
MTEPQFAGRPRRHGRAGGSAGAMPTTVIVRGDRGWAALTYRVSDRAGLGRLRAACLAEILAACGCTVQARRGRAGTGLHVYGPGPLVEHLAETVEQIAATMDIAALSATAQYGRWLRTQNPLDHMPAERRNLRRAYRRDYLRGWANAHTHRLLSTATGRPQPADTRPPPIGHASAWPQARHDVAASDPALFEDTAALLGHQARRLTPGGNGPPADPRSSTSEGAASGTAAAEGPGRLAPGLTLSCLPGALPDDRGQPVAQLIRIGATSSTVRLYGEQRQRRIPNHLLRPTWAPRIAAEVRNRGLPVSYPSGRRLLPGWQWLTWTIAEHLEYQQGTRQLSLPAAPQLLVIVACGARKRPEQCEHPAGQLYTGSYHTAARRAADTIAAPGGQVMILSARYGLLDLDEPVPPYQLRLGQPGAVTAAFLREQARQLGLLPTGQVVALAPRGYAALITAVWPHALRPLAGTRGIGDQRARLAAALATGRVTTTDLAPPL